MKKISILLLAAVMITAFVSCGNTNETVSIVDSNYSSVTYEPINVNEIKLYFDDDTYYGYLIKSDLNAFGDSTEVGMNYPDVKTTHDNTLPEVRQICINGITEQYKYWNSNIPDNVTSGEVYHNGQNYFDHYTLHLGNGEIKDVKYIHGTDNICWYSHSGFKAEGDVKSKDELNKLVDDFVNEMIPENEIAQYTRGDMTDWEFGGYIVVYRRYMFNVPTSDSVSVYIDDYGNINGYVAFNREPFKNINLSSTFNESYVLSACRFVEDKLASTSVKIYSSEPMLYANNNGELLLKYTVEPNVEGDFLEGVYAKLTIKSEPAVTEKLQGDGSLS